MKLTTIKSARKGATTVHLGENIGWSSLPFCGAMKTGKRELDGTEAAHGTVNCRPCVVEANARYLDIEPWVFIGPRLRNLIQAVREHAIANYDRGAWDIIVEAYSDSELAEMIRTCQTARGAIRKIAKIVGIYADRRAPHDAEIAAATETTTFSDPLAPEVGEPDGSVVHCTYTHDGELVALTRTWPGKVGWAQIETDCYEGEPGEFYYPGWRGVIIESPNYCRHEAAPGEVCWSVKCQQPQCCPF